MTDERFDRLLRASLEREADAAAARQPSFERAMGRLAERVDAGRPEGVRFGLRPHARRPIGLLVTVLLLAVVIVALLVVGGARKPLIADTTPSRFGTPSDCGARLPSGVVYELALPLELRRERLLEDGRLLRLEATSEDAFLHSRVEDSSLTYQRLSEAGMNHVRSSIARLGLTPGCRVVDGAAVLFTTRLADGVARLQTTPWPGGYAGFELLRTMTAAEQSVSVVALDDLTERLQADVPEAFVDRFPRPADPVEWPVEPDGPPGAMSLDEGALSGLDACLLVEPSTVGATAEERRPAPFRFSVVSPGCELRAERRRVAILAVRGERTSLADADAVAGNLFGLEAGSSERHGDGHRWFNSCWRDARPCPFAVGGWLDGVLFIAAFEGSTIGLQDVPMDMGIDVVAGAFAAIDRLGLREGR